MGGARGGRLGRLRLVVLAVVAEIEQLFALVPDIVQADLACVRPSDGAILACAA